MSAIIPTVDTRALEQKLAVMEGFTEAYKRHARSPSAIREAECLKRQLPARLAPLQRGDRFGARIHFLPVGFAAQTSGNGFGYYVDADTLRDWLTDADARQRERLQALLDFWATENAIYLTRRSFPAETAKALSSDEWTTASGVAFPLYRMAGALLDYDKLLTLGAPGLRALVEARKAKAINQHIAADTALFDGMLAAVELFVDCCRFYRDDAAQKAALAVDPTERAELLAIAAACDSLTRGAPSSFREAIQAVLLYWVISTALNFGRMDLYLARYYVRDVDSGALTEAEALELLKAMWLAIGVGGSVFDTRVVIGGRGRENEAEADRFCMLAMQATQEVEETMPQLALRFHKDTAPAILDRAYSVIAAGRTYPMLYNDDVNIPAVMKAFDLPYEEVVDYCPYGCGEYVIYRRGFGSPNGVINLLKALEITLHNGIDPVTGQSMGLALGSLADFETFDELWAAYARQVEYYIDHLAIQEDLEYQAAARAGPFLLQSLLYDDCIERGKGLFDGGARYLGGTVETYGNVNAADSLTAIKTLVYDQGWLTAGQMMAALKANFVGHEAERRLMLSAPKYGNDDSAADSMMMRVHEHVCLYARGQRDKTHLHSYLAVIINNYANTILGRKTAASADGREAFTYMANANNPSGGSDQNGLTAMLNSLIKVRADIHAGAVQNMKFSRELFSPAMYPRFRALMDVYFHGGGSQAMLSVLGREDLEDALANPEKHRNLMVRVGGFSARFVELAPDVQQEVLSRVLY